MTAIVQDAAGGLQYWNADAKKDAQCIADANGVCDASDPDTADRAAAADCSCSDSLSAAGGTGAWVDVPPRDDGAIVVLSGDFLRLLSSLRLASPLHRVVSSAERLSYVLFYYPAFDTKLGDVDTGGSGSVGGSDSNGRMHEGGAGGVKFNTLLDAASLEELRGMAFGEYIEAKWKGVSK